MSHGKKHSGVSRRDLFRVAAGIGGSALAARLAAVTTVGVGLWLPAAQRVVYAAKPAYSMPVITCGSSGQDFIDLHVCAGATGAPAGFSIQWQTLADFNQFGWPADSSCPLDASGNPTCGDSFCKASFSGNASFSRYNLGPTACVTPDVRIGNILLDNGASTSCPNNLLCGTEYVFRAFAHADNSHNRSAFTANLICSTQPCTPSCDPCVKSFGFWKQHYPDAWPADVLANGMTVGCQTYTAAQLLAILNQTPSGGNGLVALAHQVINTRLNLLCVGVSAAYAAAVSADLAAAEALMCTTGAVPPVGTGFLSGSVTGALTLALDAERSQFECQSPS